MTWPLVKLADLTSKIGSGATPTGGQEAYQTEGVPFVRSMNVHDGQFLEKGIAFLNQQQAQKLQVATLCKGDVLLNITGASVGRVCCLPDNYAGGRVNQHVAIIRPKPNVLASSYLQYYLTDVTTKAKLLRIAGSGATREAITKAAIEELEILLPPLAEQKRIAAILDQADDLRRKRQRAIDRLNQLGPAIFDEMFGDATTNPMGWRTATLGEVVRSGDKINYGVVQPGEDVEEGVPLVRVGDLLSGYIDPTKIKQIDASIEENYRRSRLAGDEILIGCVGSIGTVAIAHEGLRGANIARAVARVPVDPHIATREFLAEQIKSPFVQRYFTTETRTVAQPTLNIGLIVSAPIILPPISEQKKFAKIMAAARDTLKHLVEHARAEDTLFVSLQHLAFQGKL